jgi:hypothetical protein
MTQPGTPQDPTAEAARSGEITGGNRGDLSGRNDDQSRAIGQDNPLDEGSRQGRERYKDRLDKDLPGDPDKAV